MGFSVSLAGKEFLRCRRPRFNSWKIPWRRDRLPHASILGLPLWLCGKESTCNVGDLGSIPGLGRSPGEGNGKPLQYSCLENPMDGGDWQATVHGVAKSWARLTDNIYLLIHFGCTGSQLQLWDLHCGMQASQLLHTNSQLWHACGIQFSNQGSNPGPCTGSLQSQSLDQQGSLMVCLFLTFHFKSIYVDFPFFFSPILPISVF